MGFLGSAGIAISAALQMEDATENVTAYYRSRQLLPIRFVD